MVYRIYRALSIQTKYSRLSNFQIAADFNFFFGINTHILLQAWFISFCPGKNVKAGMGSQESGNSYTECICGLVVCAMCTHHLLGKLNHFWMQISATASKTPSTSKLWSYILHNLLLKYFLPAQSKHHFLKQRFFFLCSAGSKVMLFTCTYRLSPTNWSWLSSLC